MLCSDCGAPVVADMLTACRTGVRLSKRLVNLYFSVEECHAPQHLRRRPRGLPRLGAGVRRADPQAPCRRDDPRQHASRATSGSRRASRASSVWTSPRSSAARATSTTASTRSRPRSSRSSTPRRPRASASTPTSPRPTSWRSAPRSRRSAGCRRSPPARRSSRIGDDRALGWLRPRRAQVDGGQGRRRQRRLDHQRVQDLHHQRPPVRPRRRGRPHRPDQGRQGHLALHARGGRRGLQQGQAARQGGSAGVRHRRAVLRERAGARRDRLLGERGHGLHLDDAEAPAGAARQRHRQRRARRRSSRRRSTTPRSARPSVSRSARSSTTSSRSPSS